MGFKRLDSDWYQQGALNGDHSAAAYRWHFRLWNKMSAVRGRKERRGLTASMKSAWRENTREDNLLGKTLTSFIKGFQYSCWIQTSFWCLRKVLQREILKTLDTSSHRGFIEWVPWSSRAFSSKLQREGWLVSIIVVTVVLPRCICLRSVPVLVFGSNCLKLLS